MIRGLIVKDFRLQRYIFWWCLFGTLAVYLVTSLSTPFLTQINPQIDSRLQSLVIVLIGSSNFGFGVVCFAAAIVAGNSFTLERADRSVEFLATLPPTRWQHLQSKLLILVFILGTLAAVNAIAAIVGQFLIRYTRIPNLENYLIEPEAYLAFLSIAFCMGGVAWAASSVMNSNGGPILLGLLAPLAIYFSMIFLFLYFAPESLLGRFPFSIFVGTFLAMGISGFGSGSYWYLQRREL